MTHVSTLVLEFIGPYARLVMFVVFSFLGVMASFILSEVFEEKFYNEAGLFPIKTGEYQYVHLANIVVTLIQIFACIMCATKVIQVPHETYVKPKTLADKYIWSTHEAVFLLIAAGVNSNALAEKFFNNKFFVVIANDAADAGGGIEFLNSEDFHNVLKFGMIYSRLFCLVLGLLFIMYNLTLGGKNQYLTQPPSDPLEWVGLITASAMFITQGVYSLTHFIELWPDTLIAIVKEVDTQEIIKERHLEFVSENLSEISLSVVGLVLTGYSSATDNVRNSLACTFFFNTVFLGFYGSFFAVRTAFATHVIKNEANTSWVPMSMFIIALVVGLAADAIIYRKSIKAAAKDHVVLLYNALGANYTLVSFMWKLSIAGGLCALFMAVFSTQAQWFTFDIGAGRIPKDVAHLTADIVNDINELGAKGLHVVRSLDPCSWDASKHEETEGMGKDVSYTYENTTYGKRPFTKPSAFSMQDADISSSDCQCKGGGHCSCDYINKVKGTINKKRSDRQTLAKNQLQDVIDGYGNDFKKWGEDSSYLESLEECHSTECDIVLGIAIASETAILAGDALSFLPFVGEAVDTAAWFGQMANRIGHNVVKYATKAAKMVQGLGKRITQLEPLINLLVTLEKKTFQERYQMSLDLLMVYVPLFVNGALCFMIGFWRRENVHKVFQTYGVIVTFYIPLVLLNLTMVGLMYVFPYVIEDACRLVPSSLLVIKPKEHAGFSLLRNAYVLSAISTFLLLLSSLLDDAYYLREKAGTLRKAIKQMIFNRPEGSNADTDGKKPARDWIDMGWFQAFVISAAVPVFFILSYHYNWSFVDMQYGPSGPLLKVVNSFHSHTNILQDVQNHHSYVKENSLCGLIGEAVSSVVKFTVKELDVIVEGVASKAAGFVDSVFHFSEIISGFEVLGKKSFDVLDDTWALVEKAVTLIIPLVCSIIMLIMAFVMPRLTTGKEEVERTAKQLILIGVYYNVAMLVMMQQLFATISNLKLHVFYFEFKSGTLVAVGFIATALNAMSLFSLFVNKIYKVES